MPDMQFKNWRVAITGASGFIGRHVLAKGVELGAELHALSRRPLEFEGARSWKVDITCSDQVDDAIGRIRPDAILHLASAGVAYGTGQLRDLLNVNVVGLDNIMRASIVAGDCRAVVLAGSGFEYARAEGPIGERAESIPNSVYGISKAAAAMTATLYSDNCAVTALRLFSIFGSGEKLPRLFPHVVSRIAHGEPVTLTPGLQARDYISAGDAAEAFWRALAWRSEGAGFCAVNIGSGRRTTIKEFVQIVALEMKKRGYLSDLRFGELPYRADETMSYLPDVGLCREKLRWLPSADLESRVADAVGEFLKG